MSTTETSLRVLKCSLCDESLSVFPITFSINSTQNITKNICGRCPLIHEKDAIIARNAMYEALAEQMLFPCRYKANGCRERITPAQLCNHETYCPQRAIFCPHIPLGSCAWQGKKLELLEHFNDKHRFLVIDECVTEIDIVTNQQENYIMSFNRDLYIVQYECDGDDDILKMNVCIIGTENSRNRFQYYLSFYHTEGESSDTETNTVDLFDIVDAPRSLSKSDSTCIVKISDLRQILNDPSTIRCRINITPSRIVSQFHYDDEADGEDSVCGSSNELLNATLQRKLECPVCLSHFKVPVLQCVQGHSLCQACRPASGSCPECRANFAETRNFTLEMILELTIFNCKNDQFGCKFVGIPADLAIHEPNCAHCRPCPLTEPNGQHCPWMGGLFDILQHCRHVHSDNILDLDLIIYYFPDLDELENQVYIMNRYEQLFTLHFRCDNAANCYWHVQWLGAALIGGSNKVNYAYEVSLIATPHRISVQKPIQSEFLPDEQIFVQRNDGICSYIMIPKSQLLPFTNMDAFEYSIRIFPL